jgi:hypothetical protein
MRPAKAASDVSFVCLPLCYPPNVSCNGLRGFLTRWCHANLRVNQVASKSLHRHARMSSSQTCISLNETAENFPRLGRGKRWGRLATSRCANHNCRLDAVCDVPQCFRECVRALSCTGVYSISFESPLHRRKPSADAENPLSFPKIPSGRIRAMRENQGIIRRDACHATWDVCRNRLSRGAGRGEAISHCRRGRG